MADAIRFSAVSRPRHTKPSLHHPLLNKLNCEASYMVNQAILINQLLSKDYLFEIDLYRKRENT